MFTSLMTPLVQMALGGFLVAVGLVVTFPPTNIPFLYDNSPILAFPGVFIAGVGDPMVTIATLRCLYEIQVSIATLRCLYEIQVDIVLHSKYSGAIQF